MNDEIGMQGNPLIILNQPTEMHDLSKPDDYTAINEIQVEYDPSPGLKNRMLPRKPQLGEALNDSEEGGNLSDEETRT